MSAMFWTFISQCCASLWRRMPRWFVDIYMSPPSLVTSLLLFPLVLPMIIVEMLRVNFFPVQHMHHVESVHAAAKAAIVEDQCSISDSYCFLSGVELATRIRSRQITSVQLTKLCIRRIIAHNRLVNAVVAHRFDDALAEAAAADAVVAQCDEADLALLRQQKPLLGVPCVIKECFAVPTMPYTAGIRARTGKVASPDEICTAVHRAMAAGLVVLGSTNISEACMFHESLNPIYGLTRNPFGYSRTAGGSSGGCGASVAAHFAPLAITSDVGGSTRLPAFYCGLFGHKPTGGTVPNTHTLPFIGPKSTVSRYCQLGPTARFAKDLFPLLQIMAGSDGVDQMVRSAVPRCLQPKCVDTRLEGLVVYNFAEPFLPYPMRCGLHPQLRKAQADAAKALQFEFGCNIVPIGHAELPEMYHAFSIWSSMLQDAQVDAANFGELIENNSIPSLLWEIAAEVCRGAQRSGVRRHTVPAAGLALLDRLLALFPGVNKTFIAKGETLCARLDALLGVAPGEESRAASSSNGSDGGVSHRAVMLVPSVLCPAPRHHENLLRVLSASQTAIFNVTQHPVTAVPFPHLSEGTLPLGMQIVAGLGYDALSIAVASALEEIGIAGAPSAMEFPVSSNFK